MSVISFIQHYQRSIEKSQDEEDRVIIIIYLCVICYYYYVSRYSLNVPGNYLIMCLGGTNVKLGRQMDEIVDVIRIISNLFLMPHQFIIWYCVYLKILFIVILVI